MQTYNPEIRNLSWHNTNGRPVDMNLIKSLDEKDWLEQATFIKEQLTDTIIGEAFNQFPEAVKNENLNQVKEVLKYRRDQIGKNATDYYTV